MKVKFAIFTMLISLSVSFKAQYCTNDNRYTEKEFFTDSQIRSDNNVVFGTAVNWQGQVDTLKLNIFYPKNAVDPSPKRPFVMLMHGGGFSSGNKDDMDDQCKLFAKRGFVAATIDYRTGHNCSSDPLSYDKAVYRASQDARAALRYIVANAGPPVKVDTSWIFLGGNSAGTITALTVVYMSEAEFGSYRPTIPPLLGGLNTSGNTLTNPYTIKGILSSPGGVVKDFMQVNEMIPTISFHGDADPIIDIDSSFNGSCVNAPLLYGSRTIHRELNKAGVCNDLSIKTGGDHGAFNADFKIPKAACFFKSIFCNNCNVSIVTSDSIPAACSITTGINTFNTNTSISLYPNPAKNSVTIDGLDDKEFKVVVLDILGQQKLVALNKKQIDMSDFVSGVYIFQIQQGSKTYCNKIIRE